ncbi:hypothetical protein [Spiroplasma endosymbiont of Eupeodes luniger]|uniref:hypothetical protein n=1 Tax=Spiroplasma endosymbiont of Eupeodes luniger TaxID=3066300 RepID=UPI0030D48595
MYKEYAQYIFAGKPVINSPMDLVNPCAFKLDKKNQNNEFILTINPKTYNPWGNEKNRQHYRIEDLVLGLHPNIMV